MSSRGMSPKGDGYALTGQDSTLTLAAVQDVDRAKAAMNAIALAADPAAARLILAAVGLDDVRRAAVRAQIRARQQARGGAA